MLNIFAWSVSLATMLAVVIGGYPLQQIKDKPAPLWFALYDGVGRVVWSLALCYIIFACVHNSGGAINWFLSHPLFQPLSRLSYSIYLVHFPVIYATLLSMKSPPYFSIMTAVSYVTYNKQKNITITTAI